MEAKQIKELVAGDRVRIINPDGVAEVENIEPHPVRKADGGCFLIDLLVVDGADKGCRLNKVHAGIDKVALA